MAEETAAEEKVQEIQVPADVAFQLKIQEFDLNIAKLKAQVADIERQKMEFIYNSNIQSVTNQYKAQQESQDKPESK